MSTDLRLALHLPILLDPMGKPGSATDNALLIGPLPDLPAAERAYVIALRFLVGYRGHTLAAYRRDLADYFTWCAAHDVHVLEAGRSTIDTYARHLAEHPRGRAGRPLSPATIARRLVTLSGYYRYAVSEDVIRRNPVEHVRRPKVGQDSPSLGLDKNEAKRLLRAAKQHGARAHALVSLLIYDGLRISEALGATIEDMGERQGHHLLTVLRKGAIRREVTLNPDTFHAMTTYLEGGNEARTKGPIFATRTGNALDRAEAWRLIRRLAADADIPHADRISPHSLRHTFVTLSREAGVPLEDVQDHAGHADPAPPADMTGRVTARNAAPPTASARCSLRTTRIAGPRAHTVAAHPPCPLRALPRRAYPAARIFSAANFFGPVSAFVVPAVSTPRR